MSNKLINETSPYLLQHAHQPVYWYPFSEKVFEIAKNEDKPLIISIGYSTCHWCHVMAHQCFEDKEIAEVMNKYFICVKVDREELPDVDKYYMNALQVLTGHGGWPLNAFVLPTQKAFYALTYLPKLKWLELIEKIHHLYIHEKNKLIEYAENIHQGIKQSELALLENENKKQDLNSHQLESSLNEWKKVFDKEWGGHQYTPKFVMPVNYKFFFNYLQFKEDNEIKEHVKKSLCHIILGGLFDHVGGGFYRYSTDKYWKIPHFEKMLYDNAQMIELLTIYYMSSKEEEIKWIIEKNIQFALRDFLSDENLFYSAWDADSENEEGKFYVWTTDELKTILQHEYKEFAEIFNLHNHFGYWEHDKWVLTINISLFKQNQTEWISKIDQWTQKLFLYRKKRIHPLTDTKIITSWNALMINALTIASIVLKNQSYLKIAENTLSALLNKVLIHSSLYRIYHHSQIKIPAYLDDYAFLIHALITLAKITADTKYLNTAIHLTDQAIEEFYSSSHHLFYYNSPKHFIQQSIELYDDVLPSANAQMISNLLYLSHLNNNQHYQTIAKKVFDRSYHLFYQARHHAASYAQLILNQICCDDLEINIVGKDASDTLSKIYSQIWNMNQIYTTSNNSDFNIFRNRFYPAKTFLYVCRHSTCYEPIEDITNFQLARYIKN